MPVGLVEEKVEHDSQTSEDEAEEEDPIVKRIPLFFNSAPDFSLPSFAHFQPTLDDDTVANDPNAKPPPKKVAKPLTLLQYPFKSHNPNTRHALLPPSLRPDANVNTTPAQIYAKYKPGVRHLKLDIPLETKDGTRENRFSDERAREYAKGLPDKKSHLPGTKVNALDEEFDPIDRITLASTLVPEQTNYVVGILKAGTDSTPDELHLVPLDQTLQLRPHLEYLDRLAALNAQADKASRREEGLGSESEDDSDNEEAEETAKAKALSKKKTEANEARAVQVAVIGNADERMGSGLRSGGALFAPIRAAEAETAVALTHYHCETKESEAIRQKMFSSNRSSLLTISSWHELLKA